MDWLKAFLTTTPELAEAVAEVFSRFAPDGVVVESTRIQDERNGPGKPAGPVRVSAYLKADEHLEERKFELEKAVSYLRMIQPLPDLEFEPVIETDWMEAWKDHFQPLEVGEKFLILPSWVEQTDQERIAIKIDPGMAFGTGTHPTTQLCMELMESQIEEGQTVLDIGCGSGILSVAALKLGALKAYGVDIDEKSIENANKNAKINQVENLVHFDHGSVNEINDGLLPISKAPVIIANILAYILLRLMDEGMIDLLEPHGKLILSGILADDEQRILDKLSAHNMKIIHRIQKEDWVGLTAVKG
jgi:ribosomal protein L11 methyltransferase